MNAIIHEAIDHWIKTMKRYPSRSNLGQAGRPKKAAPTMKLSDLTRTFSSRSHATPSVSSASGRHTAGMTRTPTSSSNELLEVGADITAQLQAAEGPYVPPDGSDVFILKNLRPVLRRLRGRRPGLFE